jgi:hypothetical protein
VNWRAIGIGVAIGLGGSLVLGVMFRMFPLEADGRLWIFLTLSYLAGGVIDIATGATAGALARTRGAVHGLVAGVIATLVSPLLGYAMFWVETRGEAPLGLLEFYAGIAISGLIGIALATAAGAVAARIASARSTTTSTPG